MSYRTLLFLTTSLCSALVAGCAQAPVRPPPPFKVAEGCTRERVVFPNFPRGLHRSSGWIVLSFDLDGSGKAVNVSVLDASEPEVLDRVALEAISKSAFELDAVKTGCEMLFTFRVQ